MCAVTQCLPLIAAFPALALSILSRRIMSGSLTLRWFYFQSFLLHSLLSEPGFISPSQDIISVQYLVQRQLTHLMNLKKKH